MNGIIRHINRRLTQWQYREAAKREKWLYEAEDVWHDGQRWLNAGFPNKGHEDLVWLLLFATVLPISFGEQLSYFVHWKH